MVILTTVLFVPLPVLRTVVFVVVVVDVDVDADDVVWYWLIPTLVSIASCCATVKDTVLMVV